MSHFRCYLVLISSFSTSSVAKLDMYTSGMRQFLAHGGYREIIRSYVLKRNKQKNNNKSNALNTLALSFYQDSSSLFLSAYDEVSSGFITFS